MLEAGLDIYPTIGVEVFKSAGYMRSQRQSLLGEEVWHPELRRVEALEAQPSRPEILVRGAVRRPQVAPLSMSVFVH